MASSSTIEGSLTAVGNSEEAFVSKKRYNMSVSGVFTATVQLQRSFDNGTTWRICKEVTAPYEGVGIEVESGALYRYRCTAFISGEIFYRLGLTKF